MMVITKIKRCLMISGCVKCTLIPDEPLLFFIGIFVMPDQH